MCVCLYASGNYRVREGGSFETGGGHLNLGADDRGGGMLNGGGGHFKLLHRTMAIGSLTP